MRACSAPLIGCEGVPVRVKDGIAVDVDALIINIDRDRVDSITVGNDWNRFRVAAEIAERSKREIACFWDGAATIGHEAISQILPNTEQRAVAARVLRKQGRTNHTLRGSRGRDSITSIINDGIEFQIKHPVSCHSIATISGERTVLSGNAGI